MRGMPRCYGKLGGGEISFGPAVSRPGDYYGGSHPEYVRVSAVLKDEDCHSCRVIKSCVLKSLEGVTV